METEKRKTKGYEKAAEVWRASKRSAKPCGTETDNCPSSSHSLVLDVSRINLNGGHVRGLLRQTARVEIGGTSNESPSSSDAMAIFSQTYPARI